MDVLNTYGVVFGIIVGLGSGLLSFFYRDRLKTLIAILQQGNDELRKQNQYKDDRIVELEKNNAELRAENKVLDKQNLRLPDFAQLTKTISDNHTEQVKLITELGKEISRHKK